MFQLYDPWLYVIMICESTVQAGNIPICSGRCRLALYHQLILYNNVITEIFCVAAGALEWDWRGMRG